MNVVSPRNEHIVRYVLISEPGGEADHLPCHSPHIGHVLTGAGHEPDPGGGRVLVTLHCVNTRHASHGCEGTQLDWQHMILIVEVPVEMVY